ncbi:NACHT, LRR and PYD domains-containing protein 3-like [Cetorhinus maximus]
MFNTFAEMQICSRELNEILSEVREKGCDFRTESVRNEMNQEVEIFVQGFKHKKYMREKNKRMGALDIRRNECHRACLLAKCYTTIVIAASPREREEVECEVKARGRIRAEILRKCINKHKAFEIHQLLPSTCCKTRQTWTTVVIGAAGIGKTTLIQKMLLDWASGEMYKQFAFVFYFNFSSLNLTNDRTTLSNLIMDSYPHFDYQLERLWQEPSKLLFVFDDFYRFENKVDFDDAKSSIDQQSRYIDPECYCEVSEIVRCLIQGNLLTGCSVLITTRPWKLELLSKAKIDQTVEIVGFEPDQFKQYFRQCYGDIQFARDVTEYIEQNETLYTLCYNPLYCSVLNSLLALHLTQGSDRGSRFRMTSTRVFLAYVTSLLERSGCDRVIAVKQLLQLGEMAYTGICNRNIIFHSEQLNHQEPVLSNFITAFMLEIRDDNRGCLVYTFTHSILQDFIAALTNRQRTAGNELVRLISEWNMCTDDRLKICLRFLVGLSSRNLTDQLDRQMGEINTETELRVSDWLNENVKSLLPNMEDGKTQSCLLKMFYYLFEFGDTELMAAALKPLKTITFRQFPLKCSDCVVLSTVLMYMERMEELNLAACCIEADEIHQLELLLPKCKVLRLNDNKLGDSGLKWMSAVLKRSDCKIQKLELKSNGLTDDSVAMLVFSLSANCSLAQLDLSNDNLDSEQANRLTDKSVPALKRLMQSRTYLKEIRLRGNQFSEEGRKALNSDNESLHLTVITE